MTIATCTDKSLQQTTAQDDSVHLSERLLEQLPERVRLSTQTRLLLRLLRAANSRMRLAKSFFFLIERVAENFVGIQLHIAFVSPSYRLSIAVL